MAFKETQAALAGAEPPTATLPDKSVTLVSQHAGGAHRPALGARAAVQ